jgi:hypothetical protein
MTVSQSKRSQTILGLALFLAINLPAILVAQQTPYVVGSTVTGRVFCADSNAPARFAKVLLKSTQGDHSGEEFMKRFTDNLQKIAAKNTDNSSSKTDAPIPADKQKALDAGAKGMTLALDMMNATTVGLDGGFSFSGVKPGTYYVHVLFGGYIDQYAQFTDEDFSSTDPAVRARLAQIPTVTVSGTDSAHAEVRLERGAAISGRILYDDGSPAAGWALSVVKPGSSASVADSANAAMSQALAMSGAAQLSKTDDLGRYRIAGLAPGNYAILASLTAPSPGINATNIGDGGTGINLAVYSGSTFSRSDAKALFVAAGEENTGGDITIPSHALHNISGHVYAKSDAHTLNVGEVKLTSKTNAALQMTAAIRDDGSFHFEYLPSGITYTLNVDSAADGKNGPPSAGFMGMNLPSPEILRKYGTDSADVSLGDADVDSVRLTVAQTDWKPPVKKPGAPDVNPAELLNGIFGAAAGAVGNDKQ